MAAEFALVASVFIIVLIALIELALILLYEAGVDNGLSGVARRIQTGEVVPGNGASLRAAFCRSALIPHCTRSGVLNVRLTVLPVTGRFGPDAWLDQHGSLWTGVRNPSLLQRGDAVLVRAYFSYRIGVPFLRQALANHPSQPDRRLIGGTALTVVL